jgi:hypothetical protein
VNRPREALGAQLAVSLVDKMDNPRHEGAGRGAPVEEFRQAVAGEGLPRVARGQGLRGGGKG